MALFQKQFDRYQKRLLSAIVKGGLILENEMHRIVAIDTNDLNESISTRDERITSEGVEVKVGSRGVEYAKKVNDGEGFVYNYHRRKGATRPIVWTGDGQEWRERALVETADEITELLKSARS